MKYIPDKRLYSAVMFALRMCPSLQDAFDSKIAVAADYYQVAHDEVLKIVRQELWGRARKEAKENPHAWFTIYNPQAPQLLNTGLGNNYVLVCPKCGEHYACNANDIFKLDRLFVSPCKCGFVDNYQREYIRKSIFEKLYKED